MTTHRRTKARSGREGQALIEFSVGLLAMIIVLGMLAQIGLLGKARTETYLQATKEATENSIDNTLSVPVVGGPSYLAAMEVGDDGAKYSADDEEDGGDPSLVSGYILVHSTPDRLQSFAGPNRVSRAALGGGTMISQFELTRGRDTESVQLLPVVRRQMYRGNSIEMESEVFMPWLKGLY